MKNENIDKTREKILTLIENEFDSDASFERKVGIPQKTVNNWRRGRSSSFMKLLPAIAEAFDVNVSELLSVPIGKSSSELSDDEIEIITSLRKCDVLTAKQRVALYDTVKNVIDLYLNSIPEKKR